MVQAVFERTGDETAMLNGTDFEGGEYAVCTTSTVNINPEQI